MSSQSLPEMDIRAVGPRFPPLLGAAPLPVERLQSKDLDALELRERVERAFWMSRSRDVVWQIRNLFPKDQPGCRTAPQARGVPFQYELKSLVVQASPKRQWVVHLPAERRVCMGKIKALLGERDLRLAPVDDLAARPGRICALTAPTSSLPAVICSSIFTKQLLTTNDSTVVGFLLFPPRVLLSLNAVQVALVSEDSRPDRQSTPI